MAPPLHQLTLIRDVFGANWTLGRLFVDGRLFGFVVEDTDRGLDCGMPVTAIKAIKVQGETAIPRTEPGSPYVVGQMWSTKRQRHMLCLKDVPGFSAVQIHVGNWAKDTMGCQCPGLERDVARGMVLHSASAVAQLEALLMGPIDGGALVTYAILDGRARA